MLTTLATPTPVHHPDGGSAAHDRTAPAPRRDRFIDVLRVFAIVAVVTQHWLMPVLSYDDGYLATGNALTTDGVWAITWISQVMPLVFFAGGAAAATSLRHRYRTAGHSAATSAAWLSDRVRRLAWPAFPLLAVWLPLPHLLAGLGLPVQPVAAAAHVAGQLLWFLAAYVVVIALTTTLLRAHRRWHGLEIAALASCAVMVDLIRFSMADGPGGAEAVGYANVLFVWATLYQVGLAYGCGGLGRLRSRTAWKTAGAGLAVTALAVSFGPYPLSMIGMPGTPLSNMNPPTAVLLAVGAGQLGLAFALRPFLERWAAGAPVARALDVLSRRLMTIYLWHTPALVVVAGVAVVGLGHDTPEPFSEQWREQLPWWLLALGAVLAVLVQVFSRFEHPRRRTVGAAPWRVWVATVLIGAGLLTLTVSGFAPLDGGVLRPDAPVAGASAVVVGTALLRIHRLPGSFTLDRHERLKV